MARPPKSEKRDQQLNIKLTLRELGWVKDRASAEGLRTGEYGRSRLLAEGHEVRVSEKSGKIACDPLFMAQLSRLGNNLNQIARKLHQLGLPAPADLAGLLREIRDTLAKGMARDR